MQALQTTKRTPALFILLASVVCGALSFFIPVAKEVADPSRAHARTAAAVIMGVLFFGAIILFLRSLHGFKASLRRAYLLLATGVILFCVSLLQLPIFGLFNLWDSWWANSGPAIVPFIFATMFMYLGMQQFARLLGIRGIAGSFALVTIAAASFTTSSWVAAHYLIQYELPGADIYIAVVGWSVIYGAFAALLAGIITHVIGRHYQEAMRWLAWALAALTLSGFHEYFISFFINNGSPYIDYGLSFIPFVLSGLILLRAGFAFTKLNNTSGVTDQVSASSSDAYVASIVGVANLASRPEEIDPYLEDVRAMTSRLKPGEKLSAQDKERLLRVYQKLEVYLTTRDQLRTFTKDELRNRLPADLHQKLGKAKIV